MNIAKQILKDFWLHWGMKLSIYRYRRIKRKLCMRLSKLLSDQPVQDRFVPCVMDCYHNGMWVIKQIGGKLSIYPALVDAYLQE